MIINFIKFWYKVKYRDDFYYILDKNKTNQFDW